MAINNVETLSILLLLLLLTLTNCTSAMKYGATNSAPNTPGGKVFDQYVGKAFAAQTLERATKFIWKLFEQPTPADRKNVSSVHVYISDFSDGYAYANVPLNAINVSATAIDRQYNPRSSSKNYFQWLMHHEVTHLFQWYGEGKIRPGLAEGIADYVMVKSGTFPMEQYAKPGAGERWDEGYGVTERFLEYCDSLKPKFTVELNKRMRYGYDDSYFKEMIGKPVDQLWNEYKAKYKTAAIAAGDGEEGRKGYYPLGFGDGVIGFY
ncbi:uncharacterized protein LOC127260427 [Andrographis paniculata]|uniref:uncharacterized protein LOC127260427 n=1 Tax=Andrographis paniculata TaxID=175694 RepID=UPI0021E72D28|nr:uncharacterized protein LOC127260427 [Andrographis paniculata]